MIRAKDGLELINPAQRPSPESPRETSAVSQQSSSIPSMRPPNQPLTQPNTVSSPIVIHPSPRNALRSRSEGGDGTVDGGSVPHVDPLSFPHTPSAAQTSHENVINGILSCPFCAVDVIDHDSALCCEQCHTWTHSGCLFMSEEEYDSWKLSPDSWFCDHCRAIRANRLKWGALAGETEISSEVRSAYEKIITWRKNFFTLPRGKAGSDFLKELTRLIHLFTDCTSWERLSLGLVHVFVPIMLQKPSKKSKAKDHAKYLAARLEKWTKGDLQGLLEECKEIQKKASEITET